MSDWCTIESDPGVFTSLIESFGVQNAQLTELWALDDDSLKCILESHGKVHGLVFLFKWQSSNAISQTNSQNNSQTNGNGDGDASSSKALPLVGGEAPEDLFFARQVTTNACATQAILSILLNAQINNGYTNDGNDALSLSLSLSLGETLTNLKEFTSSFPPDLKGESIGASEEIREAHNSFARKEAFCLMSDNEKRVAGKDDEVFHFVAYGEWILEGCYGFVVICFLVWLCLIVFLVEFKMKWNQPLYFLQWNIISELECRQIDLFFQFG